MSSGSVPATGVGPGHIGTDLLVEPARNDVLDLRHVAGVVGSDGPARAPPRGAARAHPAVPTMIAGTGTWAAPVRIRSRFR